MRDAATECATGVPWIVTVEGEPGGRRRPVVTQPIVAPSLATPTEVAHACSVPTHSSTAVAPRPPVSSRTRSTAADRDHLADELVSGALADLRRLGAR
jgi:hypothetical protein